MASTTKKKTTKKTTTKKKTTKKTTKTDKSNGNSANKTTSGKTKVTQAYIAPDEELKKVYLTVNKETGTTEVSWSNVETEAYTVEITTYETKDFLEYVYVNVDNAPSLASKIIQGSVASGDVMYYENYEDERVSESDYKDTMYKKAQEYLNTYVISENVEIEPYTLANLVYGKNYHIGDLVTARNQKFGFSVDLRVTGVTEVWDSKGYTLTITLGTNVPTLTNRIKLLSKQ